MIAGVLADFGGTLFEFNYLDAIRGALDELGCRSDDALVASIGRRWRDARQLAGQERELSKGRNLSRKTHREFWLRALEPMAEFHSDLAACLYGSEHRVDLWVPRAGTRRLLALAGNCGIPLVVVSNITWNIRVLFERHAMLSAVSEFVLSFEVGVEKPSVEIFRLGCAAIDVPAPDCLMVGNDPTSDAGALVLGMPVLLVARCGDFGRAVEACFGGCPAIGPQNLTWGACS